MGTTLLGDDENLGERLVQNFNYPIEGLANEAIELLEKAWDDCQDLNELKAEAGDVLWYISDIARLLGIKLADLIAYSPADRSATNAAMVISCCDRTLLRPLGRILGTNKKLDRDALGRLTGPFASRMIANLTDVANAFSYMLNNLVWDPCEIADRNHAKLSGRFERDQINGDGDHRGETAPAGQ